jgi:6-phosphogluconate dehydrogenase
MPSKRFDIDAKLQQVLTAALYERFTSQEADYQDKLFSAMRFGFGGHLKKTERKT